MSAFGHKNVGRFDVSVNDAFRMRRVERIRNFDGQRQQHLGL